MEIWLNDCSQWIPARESVYGCSLLKRQKICGTALKCVLLQKHGWVAEEWFVLPVLRIRAFPRSCHFTFTKLIPCEVICCCITDLDWPPRINLNRWAENGSLADRASWSKWPPSCLVITLWHGMTSHDLPLASLPAIIVSLNNSHFLTRVPFCPRMLVLNLRDVIGLFYKALGWKWNSSAMNPLSYAFHALSLIWIHA